MEPTPAAPRAAPPSRALSPRIDATGPRRLRALTLEDVDRLGAERAASEEP